MAEKKRSYESEWFESARNMTPEQKEEHLASMLAEGRRQADLLLGWHGEPAMTREEVREMLAREYPGLSLSDQISEDRKSDDRTMPNLASPGNSTGKEPQGVELPDTPQWIYEMAKRYGEPTVSLDELRKMMDEELNGESLSDFVIEERRKKPY
ncbi:MAG: hypothetical protein OXH22_11945 [Chloroflexi bacterium]|nr:hypothetical protein [Chloroflexota bacterium]